MKVWPPSCEVQTRGTSRTTYWAPRLDVAEVSMAYDGSPPCPPGRTTSAPNDGLPFDAPVAPGTSAAVNATNASMLATRAIPRNRIGPPSQRFVQLSEDSW